MSQSVGSVESSSSLKPHGRLDEIFLMPHSWISNLSRLSWLSSKESSHELSYLSGSAAPSVGSEAMQRVAFVKRVYWCSEPLNELGLFRFVSPRWLPRRLAWRRSRELEGPASWELGHSYAMVDVVLAEGEERYRLNWGAGKRSATNLVIEKKEHLPESRIMGDRLEKVYEGTCTGQELYDFLLRWDGAKYDANAANNRNCHHFVQELIHACTRHAGHDALDRPE